MTVETNTPDPAALATENASLRGALETVRADFARLQGETNIVAKGATESATALAAAVRDRDAFKAQIAELEPKAQKAAELETKVTGYVNDGHETKLVEALRAKLPGAEPLVIRGVLGRLHDAGKVNRFAADTDAELAKALPIITAEAPSLTRPPTAGGGSAGVRSTTTATAPNVSLFRPNPKP